MMPNAMSNIMPNPNNAFLYPDWPAPANVKAVATTRLGGISAPPFDSLNLGKYTADDPTHVLANRRHLLTSLELTREPAWLKQVHGNRVIDAVSIVSEEKADASYSHQPGPICVVMAADCLPVLICDQQGSCVAAIHAGWRGLAEQVIAACIACLKPSASQLMAWLGPAIGPQAFEVGPEVREVFLTQDARYQSCFQPHQGDRWLADIYALARQQLTELGITAVYGGHWCTMTEYERFFSYRRNHDQSGRMATLIWLTNH